MKKTIRILRSLVKYETAPKRLRGLPGLSPCDAEQAFKIIKLIKKL